MKIGIPRAMHFYYHPRLWETFFEALGAEVVFSTPTTRRTVERASLISEAEHCLPVKLLDAHVEELGGKVDYVFVPRYLSTLKGYVSCAKLGALPDAAHSRLRGVTKVLMVEVDAARETLPESLARLGREMGFGRREVEAAAAKAIRAWEEAHEKPAPARPGRARILLVAHPYILYDEYFVGPIVRKLEEMEVDVQRLIFPDRGISHSFILWDSCNKMFHAVSSLKPHEYAGVIQVSSFNCGCDSMTVEFFREEAKRKDIPFMVLMIDEHTAQGGMDTRLEAFVDSMRF